MESGVLRSLPLFRGIDDAAFRELTRELRIGSFVALPGENILKQDDVYEDLHGLVSGTCYAEMIDSRGKTLRLENFEAPYLLAPAVLFASNNKMPGSVYATTECTVLKISRASIIDLCSKSHTVLSNLLGLVSDRFMFLSNRISFLSFRTIREKTLRYLEVCIPASGGSFSLGMSLEKLAEYFGVTRPALSRVFAELEAEGIIEREGKRIRIVGRLYA